MHRARPQQERVQQPRRAAPEPPRADALWSPNTNATSADRNAKSSARITLIYEPTTTGKVETRVHAVGEEPVGRRTSIKEPQTTGMANGVDPWPEWSKEPFNRFFD